MEAFLTTFGVVALGEIGDKTQLVAMLLAARFRRPLPLIAGMVLATLANHALAAYAGTWVRTMIPPDVLRWVIGFSFLALAAWSLKADKADEPGRSLDRYGPFVTSLVCFFLAEFGDKTQIATLALAVRFNALLPVIAGSSLGMTLIDALTMFFTTAFAHRLPVRVMRLAAAALFAVLGLLALLGGKIEL
jgi:putative Ca2+/H+ antiporter (TMEM165/GDT1 family)